MKHYLQELFEFMGQSDNFSLSVLILLTYTLAVIVLTIVLAWVATWLFDKSMKKMDYRSFYERYGLPKSENGFKIRKVK